MAGILKIDEISPQTSNLVKTESVYIDNSSCNTCIQIPNGDISQRLSTPQAGTIRYNTELEFLELYDGYEWKYIGESGESRKFLADANFYTSGNVPDLSIYGLSGTPYGTVTKSSEGGGSFHFQNQNGSYIEWSSTPDHNISASNLTFMYWVKIDSNHLESSSTGARPWLIQNRSLPGIESFIGSSNAGQNIHTWFATSNGSSWNILSDFGPNTMTIGTWYFAAITRNYSNGAYVSYWNGSSTHSLVNTSQISFLPNGPGFRLGGNLSYFLRGKIAKAKFMNVELKSSQINNIWLSEKSRFGY